MRLRGVGVALSVVAGELVWCGYHSVCVLGNGLGEGVTQCVGWGVGGVRGSRGAWVGEWVGRGGH